MTKWRIVWTRYVACMGKRDIIEETEVKISLGKVRHKFEDNIEIFLKEIKLDYFD
jgi:hypothetical protein